MFAIPSTTSDVPVRQTRQAPTSIRGKVSTAYLQDSTPDIDITSAISPTPQDTYRSVITGFPLPHAPSSTNIPAKNPVQNRKPREMVDRSTSANILSPPLPIRVPLAPNELLIDCPNCLSKHEVHIYDAHQVHVHSCSFPDHTAQTSPTILDIYGLPGYLTRNEHNQIMVKTESELFSYVRKIFAPIDGYIGEFPSTRRFGVVGLTDSTQISETSTPDLERASFYFGHSNYVGNFVIQATDDDTRSELEKLKRESLSQSSDLTRSLRRSSVKDNSPEATFVQDPFENVPADSEAHKPTEAASMHSPSRPPRTLADTAKEYSELVQETEQTSRSMISPAPPPPLPTSKTEGKSYATAASSSGKEKRAEVSSAKAPAKTLGRKSPAPGPSNPTPPPAARAGQASVRKSNTTGLASSKHASATGGRPSNTSRRPNQ